MFATFSGWTGTWKTFSGIQPLCKLRKQWRSLSHQRVAPPKQRSRSCPERCNMRRLQNCDEQLVEPERGWDGVSAFQGRCVTLPPFETRVDEKWEQGGVRLKGRECPEHSLYRSLNRHRKTRLVFVQKSYGCKCINDAKSSRTVYNERVEGHCEYSRWHQGQVTLLCLKVAKYIYYCSEH